MEMRFEINSADAGRLSNELFLKGQELKLIGQAAAAQRFYEITMDNIGDSGVARPTEWPPLSVGYARKVGRDHATLEVSGALRGSVEVDADRPEGARVHTDGIVPYAEVHQFGGGKNIPPRPYFPMDDDGNPTPYAEAECAMAAQRAIEEHLQGGGE